MKFTSLSGPQSTRKNSLLSELNYKLVGWPETVRMDSKRLFIFIASWLFLSCILLDDAEGFTIPRKRKRQQQKKRGPNNQLSHRLREMADLASQIWVCTLKMISCQIYLPCHYFEKAPQ